MNCLQEKRWWRRHARQFRWPFIIYYATAGVFCVTINIFLRYLDLIQTGSAPGFSFPMIVVALKGKQIYSICSCWVFRKCLSRPVEKNTYVCKHSRAPMLIASLARLHQTCSHDKIDTARPLPMSTVPNTIITEAFVVFIG